MRSTITVLVFFCLGVAVGYDMTQVDGVTDPTQTINPVATGTTDTLLAVTTVAPPTQSFEPFVTGTTELVATTDATQPLDSTTDITQFFGSPTTDIPTNPTQPIPTSTTDATQLVGLTTTQDVTQIWGHQSESTGIDCEIMEPTTDSPSTAAHRVLVVTATAPTQIVDPTDFPSTTVNPITTAAPEILEPTTDMTQVGKPWTTTDIPSGGPITTVVTATSTTDATQLDGALTTTNDVTQVGLPWTSTDLTQVGLPWSSTDFPSTTTNPITTVATHIVTDSTQIAEVSSTTKDVTQDAALDSTTEIASVPTTTSSSFMAKKFDCSGCGKVAVSVTIT